jgi:hypothetical protein
VGDLIDDDATARVIDIAQVELGGILSSIEGYNNELKPNPT